MEMQNMYNSINRWRNMQYIVLGSHPSINGQHLRLLRQPRWQPRTIFLLSIYLINHMKFGVPTQNEMPTTTGRLKSKPEVEFQYDGRSFSQSGSSHYSAVEWDIFTKFSTLTDTDLLWTSALPNRNRKLICYVNSRHLENFNDVITMPPVVRFT